MMKAGYMDVVHLKHRIMADKCSIYERFVASADVPKDAHRLLVFCNKLLNALSDYDDEGIEVDQDRYDNVIHQLIDDESIPYYLSKRTKLSIDNEPVTKEMIDKLIDDIKCRISSMPNSASDYWGGECVEECETFLRILHDNGELWYKSVRDEFALSVKYQDYCYHKNRKED